MREVISCLRCCIILTLCFSSDFGGIFAELLPGNFAKLQPPESQDLMDGLEVKVQLGTVWKQSLTELSGGQRYGSPFYDHSLRRSQITISQIFDSAFPYHGTLAV